MAVAPLKKGKKIVKLTQKTYLAPIVQAKFKVYIFIYKYFMCISATSVSVW